MRITEHFSLQEMTTTQIRWVDNTPDEEIRENLKKLCAHLEVVRVLLDNKPMIITSGYRCKTLNSCIGGSRTSRHMDGLAADFICPRFGDPEDVCKEISDSDIPFDQLIYEITWIHFGLALPGKEPRRQVLTLLPTGGYAPGIISGGHA